MADALTTTTGPSGGNPMLSTLSRLAPMQKVALGAAVLTLVAGTLVLTRSGTSTAMAAIYTDLEPRDAAAVTDELISRGVEYELADGGKTVLVPRDDVYDLRVGLSGEGLPSSSEGYALLDRQGLTTSEFRQRIDYQRALEGELARTLRSIDGIDSATVHLALPEESVFVDEPTQPTASVLVRTAGTRVVTSDQVNAMVHLVASSVKGMTPESVTVADATGAVLWAGGSTSGGLAGGDQRSDVTSGFENEMSNSLRALVGRVAGVENVAVTVQADLDLTERQSTTESFDSSDAESGVVVTERVSNETYSGADQAGATGVLGPDGPDGAPVDTTAPAGSESSYSKDDAERTFAVNRTVESTTIAPGQVTRLNVAVLVDEATVTEEQRATIETMIGTAAGVDLARGDQVTVTRLPFDTSSADTAAEAAELEAVAAAAAERTSMIRTGVIAFLIVIAMLLAYRSTRRARREVATPIDIGAIRAAQISDQEPSALSSGGAALAPVDPSSHEALDELSALADRRPEEVAQILQSWLAEEAVPK